MALSSDNAVPFPSPGIHWGETTTASRPYQRTAYVLLRLFLAAVMIISGTVKLSAPFAFLENILQYQLLPWPLAATAAFALPWIEVALGVCLLLGIQTKAVATVCCALCIVFVAAQVSAVARDLSISCGCFGRLSAADEIGTFTITRTAVLASAYGLLAAWSHRLKHKARHQ